MGKVISFMNNKGGCGKTTTAVSVGEYWAQLGKKILFIDLDSQGSLSSIICDANDDTEWEMTIEDAFEGGPAFGLPIIHAKENIDIVPADLSLADVGEATASQKLREWMLADLLKDVKDNYDFVIIDCPPALGLLSYNAAVASDFFIIVVNADRLSYKGSKMIWKLACDVKGNDRLNPNLSLLGVVVTRYEKNKVSELFLNRYKEDFKIYVVDPVVRKSTKLVQATSFQKSIFEIDPEGKATADYIAVAQELIKRVSIP